MSSRINKDTPPKAENLVAVDFHHTIPDVTWYRHRTWLPGQYKRFRHCHTMSQNTDGFEFFNDIHDLKALEQEGRLDMSYYDPPKDEPK